MLGQIENENGGGDLRKETGGYIPFNLFVVGIYSSLGFLGCDI